MISVAHFTDEPATLRSISRGASKIFGETPLHDFFYKLLK